jgi:hypothetical protein
MFFHSKLFKFLLPLFAYLLFAFQWTYNYKIVWYANMPEETIPFKRVNMGFYMVYAYIIIISLIIFIAFGVIYLTKNPAPKFIKYILLGNLFLSTFNFWNYSTSFKDLHNGGFFSFLILTLFAFSIFKLSGIEQSKQR